MELSNRRGMIDTVAPARPTPRFGLPRSPIWLALPGVLFLAAFLVYPCMQMLGLSVQAPDGSLTLKAFVRFFGPSVYRRVLGETFLIGLQVTVCCLLVGYPLAYWLSGLDKRRQRIISMLVLLAFWSSSLVKNFAWLILLGRNGFIEKAIHALGLHPASLLYNRVIVVFGIAHTLLPLAVVTMLPVMNQIDRRLTMAAATLGANRAQTFWHVFFVASMRGVSAAGLLVFISTLGFFITPTLLGSPREMMLGQMIVVQINDMQNWQLGSALAVILVLTTLASCVAYDLVFGLSTIAGSSGSADKGAKSQHAIRRVGFAIVDGAAWLSSRLVAGYAMTIGRIVRLRLLPVYAWAVIVVLLFPIVAVIPMAFGDSSFLAFPPSSFSTRWFQAYFSSQLWIGATLRSFGIALVTALLTSVLGTLAALGIARHKGALSSVAFIVFLLPMVIPSLVIAIALFYLCARMSLVATNTGIVLGHMVVTMPMVFVILLATVKGHDWNLNQAAATLGANRLQTLTRITLPLIKTGLATGFIIGFLGSFEELTVALFIGGGIKTTLPKQLWDNILLQVDPTLAAASTVVLAVVTLLFVAMQFVRADRQAA